MGHTQESIETTVARLDERFRGFQSAFSQMADDQRRMAESYEKLVESGQRIALVENDVISLKDGQKQIWIKLDAHAKKVEDLTVLPARSSEKWLWEIIRMVLAVAGTVIAFKVFGVHP